MNKFKIHTILPYTSLKRLSALPLENGGVESIVMSTRKSAPHQLKITVNPNLGSSLYNFFLREKIGLRVDFIDGKSFAFVKRSGGLEIEQSLSGSMTVRFLSHDILLADILQNPRIIPFNQVYTGTLSNFISQLGGNNYIFTPVSADRNIKVNTGFFDNHRLLIELTEQLNKFEFINNGVVSVGANDYTEIEYGDFDQKDIQLSITNITKGSNRLDANKVQVSSAQINYSGEAISHLVPIGSTGGGTDTVSLIYLTGNNNFVDGDFPLYSAGSLADGSAVYGIRNINSTVDRGMIYDTDISSAIFNSSGDYFEYTSEEAEELLYKRAVNYLKSKQDNKNYIIELDFNTVILPLTKVAVEIEQTTDYLSNTETVSIKDTLFVGENEFDLATIQ